MRYIFLLSLFFLAACVNTKQIDLDAIQTTSDFETAKHEIFAKFHKNYHLDAPWAKGQTECVSDLSQDLVKLKDKLVATVPNTSLISLEETDMLSLFMATFLQQESLFQFYLYAIQKHDSLETEMMKYEEIGANDNYEEKVLAQAISYSHAIALISQIEASREDKDMMILYATYLLVKYGYNSKNYELTQMQRDAYRNKNEWLAKTVEPFLKKYPDTQYQAFIKQWTL